MTREEKKIIFVIKQAIPAVVSIVISKHLEKAKPLSFDGIRGPFTFSVPEQQKDDRTHPEFPREDEEVKVGGGSGFFIGDNGLILTNKHVVLDKDAQYTVITADNKTHPARILSIDRLNDIAFIKIDAHAVPTLKIGNSKNVSLGETVITIGNPLGMFQNTVSKGIVSGLNRKIAAALGESEVEELRGMIQTDAAINQGNSGGPLINLNCEVVGINTAIIYGAQSMGFAIPINAARKDIESVLEHGKIIQPYIGVRFVTLTPEIQKQYELPVDYGALIVKGHLPTDEAVIKKSPAEKAGLRENDIVLSLGKHKISSNMTITDLLQNYKVGDDVELTVLRDGEKTKKKLTLEEHK